MLEIRYTLMTSRRSFQRKKYFVESKIEIIFPKTNQMIDIFRYSSKAFEGNITVSQRLKGKSLLCYIGGCQWCNARLSIFWGRGQWCYQRDVTIYRNTGNWKRITHGEKESTQLEALSSKYKGWLLLH